MKDDTAAIGNFLNETRKMLEEINAAQQTIGDGLELLKRKRAEKTGGSSLPPSN